MGGTIVQHLPLLALLLWAAVIDWRHRRIPNWLTLLMLVSGVCQSFGTARTVSPASSLAGIFAAAAIPLALFAIGAIGGGDVKLMAGIGAWIGPWPALAVLLVEKVLGLVIVLAQATRQGTLALLLRNSTVVAVNLAHLKQVGVEHARETGQACRSIDRPLPFAVPAGIAVLVVLLVLRSH